MTHESSFAAREWGTLPHITHQDTSNGQEDFKEYGIFVMKFAKPTNLDSQLFGLTYEGMSLTSGLRSMASANWAWPTGKTLSGQSVSDEGLIVDTAPYRAGRQM
eukprot:932998-Pelagomonas_calceolata.AAC.3